MGHLYSALLWDEPTARASDMARESKGITQFYLPPTHKPYLPLLPTPQPQGITALLIEPTHGGMADLSWLGWLVIHWDRFSGTGSWTPDTVTHPCTNRVRNRLTSLIETNALTTPSKRQPYVWKNERFYWRSVTGHDSNVVRADRLVSSLLKMSVMVEFITHDAPLRQRIIWTVSCQWSVSRRSQLLTRSVPVATQIDPGLCTRLMRYNST